jgi:membrane associated rhomboid family serine protease
VPQCQRCTKRFESSAPSSDICPECAAAIRSDSTLAARPGDRWKKSRALRLPFPWLSLLLAALIVAIYYLQAFADPSTPKHPYDPVLLAIGMRGEAVFVGQWWRLVTAIFVHIDLHHSLSNLCFLLLFGSIAESVFQRAGYLALWFLTGIAGSMAQMVALTPKYYDFGASGVAFGLVGALWGAYFLERVPSPAIKRRWSVVILLGFFIILGFSPDWLSAHSFNAAHLGGLLAGMISGSVIPVRTTPAPIRRLCVIIAIAGIVFLGFEKIARGKHTPQLLQTDLASPGFPSESPSVPGPPR